MNFAKKYLLPSCSIYFIPGLIFYVLCGIFHMDYSSFFTELLAVVFITGGILVLFDCVEKDTKPIIIAGLGWIIAFIISCLAKRYAAGVTDSDYLDALSYYIYYYDDYTTFGKLLGAFIFGGTFFGRDVTVSCIASVVIYYVKLYFGSSKENKDSDN